MSYQQPPYQTTVMQPVVVPVVVPVVSGPGGINRGPAFIRNGAKLCGITVGGNCIFCMSIYGVIMVLVSLPTVIITAPHLMSFGGAAFPIFIPMLIGAPFAIISCILCIKAKKSYDEQRSQESTLPYSEPFTDARNPSAAGIGSHMYVPVPSHGGLPPQTVYPQGSVVSYPNTASSGSYPAQMYAIQQPPQSGMNNALGAPYPGQPGAPYPEQPGAPYPGQPSYSVPGKGSSQEDYQPPAYAPPSYSP